MYKNFDTYFFHTNSMKTQWAHDLAREIRGVLPIKSTIPLRSIVQGFKPRVVATIVGRGCPAGPLLDNGVCQNPLDILPVDWLDVSDKELVVIAITCHSVEYLSQSQYREKVSASIGFEGFLWYYHDDRSDVTRAFWVNFFSKIFGAIKCSKCSVEDIFMQIMNVYTQAYLKGFLRGRILKKHEMPPYLARICLAQHAMSMRRIGGPGNE